MSTVEKENRLTTNHYLFVPPKTKDVRGHPIKTLNAPLYLK